MQRGQGRGNGRHEAVIKIYTTEKALQIDLGLGAGNGPDRLRLGCQRADAAGTNRVSQERHRGSAKDTLFTINGESGIHQTLQKLSDVRNMGRQAWARHKNIVEIGEKKR